MSKTNITSQLDRLCSIRLVNYVWCGHKGHRRPWRDARSPIMATIVESNRILNCHAGNSF